MRVTLDNIKYRGMYFDTVSIDIPEIKEYDPSYDVVIMNIVKEHLDHEIFEETCKRG